MTWNNTSNEDLIKQQKTELKYASDISFKKNYDFNIKTVHSHSE
jgi:hypothetical protein